MMAGAQNAFELLAARYPDTPNVHYAYGVFLLAEQPEQAIELFQRELKVSPQNVCAKLQIAFAYIRRGEYARGAALGASRRSTRRRPSSSPATRWARRCSRPGTSTGAIASSRPA